MEERKMCRALEELAEEEREKGCKKGREEMNRLILALSKAGRTDDLVRVATDKEYRKQLMEEFLIN